MVDRRRENAKMTVIEKESTLRELRWCVPVYMIRQVLALKALGLRNIVPFSSV